MDDRPSRQDLPPMQEGVLDDGALAALEADLNASAEVIEVMLKAHDQGMAGDHRPSLAEAFAALRAGDAHGLQVRYRFEGTIWIDTLLRNSEGVRIVRLQDPFGPAPGGEETS